MPKSQALWETNLEMRNAVNGRSCPPYATRDWDVWVLTGDPE